MPQILPAHDLTNWPHLPPYATLPINRCNLPPRVIASLGFQQHPQWLEIDGVHALHRPLMQGLAELDQPGDRTALFLAHMAATFSLHDPIQAGYSRQGAIDRSRANWQRILRGWALSSDSREAALLKGWVESRFGLLTRWHNGPINHPDSDGYRHFQAEWARAIYGANSLEAQCDLIYTYTQYTLRQQGAPSHFTLYRGVNRLHTLEVVGDPSPRHPIVLMNNLTSFSADRDRAGEFGDLILKVAVPGSKILLYPRLLPGLPESEAEFLVIGGLYRVERVA
jgi:NAD+---dinitrogen-reductase ADP-D-ribosyltransferase